jgi:hypothetical protein
MDTIVSICSANSSILPDWFDFDDLGVIDVSYKEVDKSFFAIFITETHLRFVGNDVGIGIEHDGSF